jgi:hypothetical protein
MKRPYWYVHPRFIRKKTRHTWTNSERKEIYTLRIKGLSIDAIIQKLKLKNLSRIPVYNVIRDETNLRKGKCSCGAILTAKEKSKQEKNVSIKCNTCLKKNSIFKKNLRREYLRKHLCGICGKRKTMPGYTTCRLCLSPDYRRSYAQGLCGRCHTKPISKHSKSFCDSCLEINRKKTRKYRIMAKRSSLLSKKG